MTASTSVAAVPTAKENSPHQGNNIDSASDEMEVSTKVTDIDVASGTEHDNDMGGGEGEATSGKPAALSDVNTHSDDVDSSSVEESSDGDESSSSDEEEDDDDNNNNNDGLSEYERLRLMRIQRNQARLQQLGLLDETNKLSKTNNSNRSHQKKPDGNKRKPKPEDLVGLARSRPKREIKTIHQWDGGLDIRKLRVSHGGGKNKKKRCGECEGCTREHDCFTCIFCFDRASGRAHPRRCLFKQCRRYYRNRDGPENSNNDKAPGTDGQATTAAVRETSAAETTIAAPTTGNETNSKQEESDSKLNSDNDNATATATSDIGGGDKKGDTHNDYCDVCKDGGDLFLCGNCDRAFHSTIFLPTAG